VADLADEEIVAHPSPDVVARLGADAANPKTQK
jgi:hypothetical protein